MRKGLGRVQELSKNQIKVKAYFKDNDMYNPPTEGRLFKPKANKKWGPDKNYHSIETYIEPIKNPLKTKEQNNNKKKHYNNLTKGERISRSKWYNYKSR